MQPRDCKFLDCRFAEPVIGLAKPDPLARNDAIKLKADCRAAPRLCLKRQFLLAGACCTMPHCGVRCAICRLCERSNKDVFPYWGDD